MNTLAAIMALIIVLTVFGFAPVCAVVFCIQTIRLKAKVERLKELVPQKQKEQVKEEVEESLDPVFSSLSLQLLFKEALSDEAIEYIANVSELLGKIKAL